MSKPQIVRLFTQVNHVWSPQKEGWTERLTVYANVINEDGMDELDRLYIQHDQSRLWWKLQKDSWNIMKDNGEFWIGSNALQSPYGENLPMGQWKVKLISHSGDWAKAVFTLSSSSRFKDKHVKDVLFSQQADFLEITGFPSSFLIWIYDEKENILLSRKQVGKRILIDSLLTDSKVKDQAYSCAFYSYFPQEGQGMIAGPYLLKK